MKTGSQNDLEARLKRHFREVLSMDVDPRPWSGKDSLPAFLREAYAFRAARILEAPCLFVLDRGVQQNTPAAIRKHLFEIGKRWDGEVVYVAAGIDSARRKQLIDQKVPFVVPGNQVFLPMLGIDLREHFRSVRGAAESLSPSTQAVFLHALHRRENGAFSPQEMAAALGYSNMTLSRAFDELEIAGLGRHSIQGRRRLMEFSGSGRDLWEKARPLLRTPVSRTVMVKASNDEIGAPVAGLTGLAVYTSLAEPEIPVIAVARSAWPDLRTRFPKAVAMSAESPAVEIEVWTYPPRAVADGPSVDRLSLYLSLRGTADERVEAALDELLEGMKW
jgi:DNA-binding MarR family transcriptional regulator